MKKYVAPALQIVELRAEEGIANFVSGCTGACKEDILGNDGTVLYVAQGS